MLSKEAFKKVLKMRKFLCQKKCHFNFGNPSFWNAKMTTLKCQNDIFDIKFALEEEEHASAK